MSQQNQLILFLGKRGTGKSTLQAKKLNLLPRFVIYDTLGEDTYSKFERIEDFQTLCEAVKRDCFRIAYRGDEGLSMEQDFDFCTRLVYAQGNMTYAVDEIDLHTSPLSLSQSMEDMVSLGRHRNVDFYCTSRRPYAIHPLIRSQANKIYSFAQTEPRDLKWCEQVMQKEIVDRLPNLPRYEFIEWEDTFYSISKTQDDEPSAHSEQDLTEDEPSDTMEESPSPQG